MTTPITLEETARQAIDGDREALESLVRTLQADVYGLSLRMPWNREDAEDATQEILVRIVTRLSQFDFRSRLKTWAYRVAVRPVCRVGGPAGSGTSSAKPPSQSGVLNMNRRHAIGTTLKAAAVASVLRTERAAAHDAGAKAPAEGHTLHLDPASGQDANSGAQGSPLRTLAEAARRVNQGSGSGAMTVVLAEGVYAIGETTLLKPESRAFSKSQRLTIRAEILPDDPEWHIGRMPTLVHTLPLSPTWNGRPDPLGGAANGMLVETSHVTVRGLKILGLPVVESPRPGLIRRLYGISRLRRDLEDLEVAQCLFAGDEVTSPHHVAIIANGNGINVHHCVFRGLKISAVYWTPGSSGHAMTHCLCHDLYGSGVWTAGIANDFVYRNNVVEACNYVWTSQGGSSALADAAGRGGQPAGAAPAKQQEPVHYKVVDSYFGGNRRLTGSGTGARLEYEDIDPSFLELIGTKVAGQPVVLERDSTRREYLHPVAGSDAAKVGAGLFTKPLA